MEIFDQRNDFRLAIQEKNIFPIHHFRTKKSMKTVGKNFLQGNGYAVKNIST